MNKLKYYNIDEILKYHAQYYMIFGQRSNGKSYSVTRYAIKRFFEFGEEIVICKRYEDDMKAKLIGTYFDDHLEYIKNEYNHGVKFYRGKWYVYPLESEGKLSDCLTMAHAMSISACDKYKAGQYPRVNTVIFEEFMSMNSNYLNNEINLFINLISTIVRNRQNIKIFMLGNAIARVSPYSKALGVRLDRMEHGSIVCKEFKDQRGYTTTFVIQRCENVNVFSNDKQEKKVVYSVFGHSHFGNMIRSGEFETGVYRKQLFNITLQKNLLTVEPSKHGFYDLLEDVGFFTNIYIIYEGYMYRLIMNNNITNAMVGFIEVDEIENENLCILVNTMEFVPNCMNVVDFNAMDWNNNFYLEMLRKALQLIVQDKFIVESDEDGQNIVDALINCGLTELKKR